MLQLPKVFCRTTVLLNSFNSFHKKAQSSRFNKTHNATVNRNSNQSSGWMLPSTVPHIELMIDIRVCVTQKCLDTQVSIGGQCTNCSPWSSSKFSDFSKANCSIATELPLFVTWTSCWSTIKPLSTSMHVQLQYFAENPGLSERPSPISLNLWSHRTDRIAVWCSVQYSSVMGCKCVLWMR